MARDMTDIWIGNSGVYGNYVVTEEYIHQFKSSQPFNKKKLALAIGEYMIATGCVKVESQYRIETCDHLYTWVARPFSKEKRLPA